MVMDVTFKEDILPSVINNKMMLVYGKISSAKNNASATYTLPKAFTTINYVCIANAILKNHWANIIGQTTSTITIYVEYSTFIAHMPCFFILLDYAASILAKYS